MPAAKLITALLSLMATAALHAQAKPSAAIPATPVTSTPPATVSAPSSPPSYRATVTWANGMLSISANNSSLNSILRDIALKTGMKIIGGVQDERVFGKYGPGTAATVIAQLMDGTRCNVMLQSDAANLPLQLTLTPVTGGVTPPNPMQARSDQQELPQQPDISEPPQRPVDTGSDAAVLPPGHPSQPAASGTDNTTTDQSPNGVRTPEQIFRQLQELRRRNQQPTQ